MAYFTTHTEVLSIFQHTAQQIKRLTPEKKIFENRKESRRRRRILYFAKPLTASVSPGRRETGMVRLYEMCVGGYRASGLSSYIFL